MNDKTLLWVGAGLLLFLIYQNAQANAAPAITAATPGATPPPLPSTLPAITPFTLTPEMLNVVSA